MGWSIGYDNGWQRDIGYGVPAYCDHLGCSKEIDRGLAYVCGNGQPYGGDEGCGLYFCDEHGGGWLCERCDPESTAHGLPTFEPSPDHPDWINWKLTDESWQQWRDENPTEVDNLQRLIAKADPKPQGSGE